MTATLTELHTPSEAAHWLKARVSGTLHADSRQLKAGDGFIAWPGAASDGRLYVKAALDQGASACLVELEGACEFGFDSEAIAGYAGLKPATGPIAAAYFGQPSQSLDVLAVTGTNGKTSTSWWLAQALHVVGRRCAVVGTLGVGEPPALDATGLTTPDPVLLQRQFRRFLDAGIGACAIEASSIGLAEQRLDGTQVRVALLTNFTQDHLDYHGTMERYWQAKAALFAWPGLQAAVINVDDEHGAGLAAGLQSGSLDLWTVSCARAARLQASDIRLGPHGLSFSVCEGIEKIGLETALIGHYNVSNLLLVLAGLRALDVPLTEAVRACGGLTPVPGRMDCVLLPGQPLAVVDYAHTPDALAQVLAALRPLANQRQGRLWCVFGCGGNRDAIKRPLMAAVAEQGADQIMVTSDNPRNEKPEAIISQILLGLSHRDCVRVQADRALAIDEVLQQAAPADVVLIAGKGHETTQDIAGVRHTFDDKAVARGALLRRAAAPLGAAA